MTTAPVRIGVLVPAGNPTVEPELYRMAPSSVTLHFARIDGREGTPGAPDGMEQRLLAYADALPLAVPPLAAVLPRAVVLAHTSLSYAVGFANEPTLIDCITRLAGCPGLTASRAILAAFTHLGVRRIALDVPADVWGAPSRRHHTWRRSLRLVGCMGN